MKPHGALVHFADKCSIAAIFTFLGLNPQPAYTGETKDERDPERSHANRCSLSFIKRISSKFKCAAKLWCTIFSARNEANTRLIILLIPTLYHNLR